MFADVTVWYVNLDSDRCEWYTRSYTSLIWDVSFSHIVRVSNYRIIQNAREKCEKKNISYTEIYLLRVYLINDLTIQ
jgi:hypothetical protein